VHYEIKEFKVKAMPAFRIIRWSKNNLMRFLQPGNILAKSRHLPQNVSYTDNNAARRNMVFKELI